MKVIVGVYTLYQCSHDELFKSGMEEIKTAIIWSFQSFNRSDNIVCMKQTLTHMIASCPFVRAEVVPGEPERRAEERYK